MRFLIGVYRDATSASAVNFAYEAKDGGLPACRGQRKASPN